MKLFKLLFVAAGATVLLGALVSSASARNLSVSNQSISGMWREVIFSGLFGETNCEVTLEGSLHSRTMIKSIGTLMGYITSAIVSSVCRTGAATILRETLPWHISYSGFRERLPEIDSLIIHVVGAGFRIREPGGINCLARTSATQPGIGTFHRSTLTHELTEASIGGRIRTGSECLAAEGTLSSVSGPVSLQGRPEVRISVSLI